MINLSLIKILQKQAKSGWYLQRFDACPQFIGYVGEAETRPENRKPKGTEATIRLSFFEDGKADWYLAIGDIKRGTDKIVRLAKKDSRISQKLMASWKEDETKFDQFFEQFKKINLTKLTNIKLKALFKRFYHLCLNRYSSSCIIDHFALGTDQLISALLRKEVSPFKKESQFTDIFSIATAPIYQSFINEAEENLLKIAIKVVKVGNIESTQIGRFINEHQQKFFWIKNNYINDRVLGKEDFKKEIKAWVRTKKDLKEQLLKLHNTSTENQQKKKSLFKKYKFSQLLKTLLKISEDFTYWQDERKRCTYLSTHMGNQILKEMAKRIGYDLEEMKYLLPSETLSCFENQKPSRALLRQRINYCARITLADEDLIFTKGDAQKIKEIALNAGKPKEIQDLRGLVACTGRAIGTAKIMKSATEIDKVKTGDILIAVMTRPDYVPAMRKSAAIVTDEGGITSHAAIVSRELGIPCIIGTKIATQVFKDGDKIEVNANHNWVRKVK